MSMCICFVCDTLCGAKIRRRPLGKLWVKQDMPSRFTNRRLHELPSGLPESLAKYVLLDMKKKDGFRDRVLRPQGHQLSACSCTLGLVTTNFTFEACICAPDRRAQMSLVQHYRFAAASRSEPKVPLLVVIAVRVVCLAHSWS